MVVVDTVEVLVGLIIVVVVVLVVVVIVELVFVVVVVLVVVVVDIVKVLAELVFVVVVAEYVDGMAVPYHIVNGCPQCGMSSPGVDESVKYCDIEELQQPPVNLGLYRLLFVPQNEKNAR